MMGHVTCPTTGGQDRQACLAADRLDAGGLSTLLRNGTLPSVWLPPASVRDERELPRTRMMLSHMRSALKNRIHATLAKYALSPDDEEFSDLFSKKGRIWLGGAAKSLPPETGRCLAQELELVDALSNQIGILEDRIRQRIRTTPNMQLLETLPGVGDILAIVIEREVGSIDRFHSPEQFASYSGTTPKVSASLSWRTRPGRWKSPLRSHAPGG
jgi:transposase